MSNGKGLFSTTNIVIFGAVAVVMVYIAVVFVRAKYFGAEQGASCTQATDCNIAVSWCMKAPDGSSKFCTRACVADQGCPSGWVCGDSGSTQTLTKTSSGAVGIPHAVNVCWPATGKGKPPPMRY